MEVSLEEQETKALGQEMEATSCQVSIMRMILEDPTALQGITGLITMAIKETLPTELEGLL